MAGGSRKRADGRLLLELASGATVAAAAEAAGLGERTVYARLNDPDFRAQLSRLRGDVLDRAVGRLADSATDAVETLRGLLTAESESVRLGAARAILELGTRLREASELEQRITTLERDRRAAS